MIMFSVLSANETSSVLTLLGSSINPEGHWSRILHCCHSDKEEAMGTDCSYTIRHYVSLMFMPYA